MLISKQNWLILVAKCLYVDESGGIRTTFLSWFSTLYLQTILGLIGTETGWDTQLSYIIKHILRYKKLKMLLYLNYFSKISVLCWFFLIEIKKISNLIRNKQQLTLFLPSDKNSKANWRKVNDVNQVQCKIA